MPDAAAKPAEPEVPPDTDPAIRTIAMPADTNPHGDIFGGWLLCQMDLAGASVAVRRAGGRVVTAAITAMVESWALRGTGLTPIKVTEGLFTYVRVGPDGRPQPIAAA